MAEAYRQDPRRNLRAEWKKKFGLFSIPLIPRTSCVAIEAYESFQEGNRPARPARLEPIDILGSHVVSETEIEYDEYEESADVPETIVARLAKHYQSITKPATSHTCYPRIPKRRSLPARIQ